MTAIIQSTWFVVLLLLYQSNSLSKHVFVLSTNVPSPGQKGPFLWDLNENASSQGSGSAILHKYEANQEVTSRSGSRKKEVNSPLSGSKRPSSVDNRSTVELVWGDKKARSDAKKPRSDLPSFQFTEGTTDTNQMASLVSKRKQSMKKNVDEKAKEKYRTYFRLRKQKGYKEKSTEERKAFNAKRYEKHQRQLSRFSKEELVKWRNKRRQQAVNRRWNDNNGLDRPKRPRLFD